MPRARPNARVRRVSVFGAYSQYYDLLYRDKDYAAEVDYVARLIEREKPGSKSVLDLGCGTGRHDFLLSERGYQVTGVDMSADMLKVADTERARRLAAGQTAPKFAQGDVRSVRLGERFDVVVSLFHVMSYQSTNQDLLAGLSTLREHVEPGGLVLFDAWYGPTVLTDRPVVRHKRLQNDDIEVLRLAEPVLYPNDNFVDVNYQILIKDRRSERTQELHESHRMRYLFVPETQLMLERVGLRLTRACEFGTDGPLGFDTWNALFIATTA
jgi:SAM-dependent methyltransferase